MIKKILFVAILSLFQMPKLVASAENQTAAQKLVEVHHILDEIKRLVPGLIRTAKMKDPDSRYDLTDMVIEMTLVMSYKIKGEKYEYAKNIDSEEKERINNVAIPSSDNMKAVLDEMIKLSNLAQLERSTKNFNDLKKML